MTTMLAQHLWPRFTALIHTAMSTNYSSKTLSLELSELLSEIRSQCPNLNSNVISKLQSIAHKGAINQGELPLDDLCDAYEVLTKKYIDTLCKNFLSAGSKEEHPERKYLIEIIDISLKWDALNLNRKTVLRHSVDALGDKAQKKDLEKICLYFLKDNNCFDFFKIDGVEEHVKELKNFLVA